MKVADIAVDPDCGRAHLGRCGGVPYAKRLRSVRLSESATPTRTRRNDFDAEAVAAAFGPDSEEQMLDETEGRGPVYRHPRGGFTNLEGEAVHDVDDFYLDGPEVDPLEVERPNLSPEPDRS